SPVGRRPIAVARPAGYHQPGLTQPSSDCLRVAGVYDNRMQEHGMAEGADSELSDTLRELAEGAGEAAIPDATPPQGDGAAVLEPVAPTIDPTSTMIVAEAPSVSTAPASFTPSQPRLAAFRGFMIPFCTTIGLLNVAIGCWGVGVL